MVGRYSAARISKMVMTHKSSVRVSAACRFQFRFIFESIWTAQRSVPHASFGLTTRWCERANARSLQTRGRRIHCLELNLPPMKIIHTLFFVFLAVTANAADNPYSETADAKLEIRQTLTQAAKTNLTQKRGAVCHTGGRAGQRTKNGRQGSLRIF